MLLKHFSKREKSILYFAIVIITGIVLYSMALEPLWKKWKDLNESISNKEIQIIKNLKIMAQKDTISRLYDQYAENIKMKGSEEEETATILREIENIARMSSTRIIDIKPHKVQDMDFYKEYTIELEAEGDVSNLSRFIYELQSSKQILKVKHLRLNPKDDTGSVLKGYMIVSKILIP